MQLTKYPTATREETLEALALAHLKGPWAGSVVTDGDGMRILVHPSGATMVLKIDKINGAFYGQR